MKTHRKSCLNISFALLEEVRNLIRQCRDLLSALLFPFVVEPYSLGFPHLFAQILALFVNHCKQRLRSFHVTHPRRRLGHSTHLYVTSIRIQQLLFDNFSPIFALMFRHPHTDKVSIQIKRA
jgi:hypothetical protein